MAKPKKGDKKDVGSFEPRVVLRTYPARRFFVLLMTVVMTAFFSIWLWSSMRRGDMPWYLTALPMIFIGMLANFLAPTEEWEYTPWQESTQKYEKNIYE